MKIYLIIIFTKLINQLIKIFKLGSGNTLAGFLILKVYPNILKENIFKYKKGIILVTGTNGKTTTTKLISDVLKDNNYKVLHNSSGSNLLRGIVTSLILDLNIFAKPKSDVAVLEVDELNLPIILKYIKPKALVLLNLSRDQLDRYGEVDTIILRWIESIRNLPKSTNLIINSTQPSLLGLKNISKAKILEFNEFLLKGLYSSTPYNISNINACIKVCDVFKISFNNYKDTINNFENAYGRGEEIKIDNTTFKIFLAKNPNSFNNNLLALENINKIDGICFVLNDKEPDGKDISWIYDIDNSLLNNLKNHKIDKIYISGSRAYDMALRLKLLDFELETDYIFKNISNFKNVIDTSKEQFIVVLPNYSSMLAFRKLYLGKDIL